MKDIKHINRQWSEIWCKEIEGEWQHTRIDQLDCGKDEDRKFQARTEKWTLKKKELKSKSNRTKFRCSNEDRKWWEKKEYTDKQERTASETKRGGWMKIWKDPIRNQTKHWTKDEIEDC